MAQITGGKIAYGRTVKTGDFESKRVDVELAFSVDDGEDYGHAFDLVSRQVARRCEEMVKNKEWAPAERLLVSVGTAETPVAGKTVQQVVQSPVPPHATPAVPADTDKPKRGRPPKVKAEAPVEPKPEPEVAENELAKEYAATTLKAIEKAEAANDEVTDKQLQEACAREGKRVGPDKVKKLRDEIAGQPVKSINELAQNLRRKFLTELAVLS